MKLIVGLGNPGKSYRNTPHNVGFGVIDELASRLSGALKNSSKFEAEAGKVVWNQHDLMLVKPMTYMNNSGLSVGLAMRFHKIALEDLIVVVDDADLGLGQLRVRSKGSAGGHNGLKSVKEHVGSDAYARVRFGVGRGLSRQSLESYVLKPFNKDDVPLAETMIERAADAVLSIVDKGVDAAMNAFNANENSDGPR